MPILAVSNLAMDWGGNATDTTSTLERDPLYSPTGIFAQTDTPMVMQPFAEATGDLWFHFKWRAPSSIVAGGSDGYAVSFYSNNNTLVARMDLNNGSFSSTVFGDSVVSGDSVLGTNSAVQTFDMRFVVSPTEVTMEMYLGGGGAPVSTATSTNTGGKTIPTLVRLDIFDIANTSNSDVYFSEFIVTDNEDTRGWRLATLEPNTNGTYDEWLGDVTELGDRDPATSASANAGALKQSWNPTAYAGPVTVSSVRAVVTKAQTARGSGASPAQLTQFLRIGGTDYNGASVSFTQGERRDVLQIWDDNPDTTLPWTAADLATFEVGLLSTT